MESYKELPQADEGINKMNGGENKWVVGAKKNTDGTVDYSNAAYVEGMSEHMKRADEEKNEKWNESLKLPEDVSIGTFGSVRHDIDSTIRVQKRAKDKKPELNVEAEAGLSLQYAMMASRALDHRIKSGDESIRLEDVPASEVAGAVQEIFVEKFEDEKRAGKTEVEHYGNIDVALRAAKNLHRKLLDEASRSTS